MNEYVAESVEKMGRVISVKPLMQGKSMPYRSIVIKIGAVKGFNPYTGEPRMLDNKVLYTFFGSDAEQLDNMVGVGDLVGFHITHSLNQNETMTVTRCSNLVVLKKANQNTSTSQPIQPQPAAPLANRAGANGFPQGQAQAVQQKLNLQSVGQELGAAAETIDDLPF